MKIVLDITTISPAKQQSFNKPLEHIDVSRNDNQRRKERANR